MGTLGDGFKNLGFKENINKKTSQKPQKHGHNKKDAKKEDKNLKQLGYKYLYISIENNI